MGRYITVVIPDGICPREVGDVWMNRSNGEHWVLLSVDIIVGIVSETWWLAEK